jgi:Cys-rich protein (TIGR01571 family)
MTHSDNHPTVNATPVFVVNNGQTGNVQIRAPWATGILQCFDDVDGTLEGMFCSWCQNSRQYNLMTHDQKEVMWWPALGSLGLDICFGFGLHIGTFLLTLQVRQQIRHRFNIDGTDAGDCLAAFFIPKLATCQQYRELSNRGLWTGGYCVSEPFAVREAPQPMTMGDGGKVVMNGEHAKLSSIDE